ncbi:MAG: succinylglutamate-semialdehyde dehydrogenase [Gammaproteobacteria bacterium]|nr:succinylglutamate-semialdehyde dehydrogenase [Gammaproteobacteria bacterium]MCY4356137.1 succinylglutamate-semialdehyde dehydrogenase [Gammaproteobacteria bacterium]
MEARQQHFVDGKWVTGGSHYFESLSPIDNSLLWRGSAAKSALVLRALAAAHAALNSWRELSIEQRKGFIDRFVKKLKANHDQLTQILHLETGKPVWECKTEIASMQAKADISFRAYAERTGERQTETDGIQLTLAHKPIGVFVVLGPYNFPGHLPNGHIIPALLAGNTIIFKPSELTPLFGELVVQCWEQAGLPRGVLNLVQGEADTGRLLAGLDGIDGLLFTGSSKTGHAIHKAFAGQPHKMLALEMGGNNPLVVNRVADTPAAVYSILQSAFITAGQRCTCARRLILVRHAQNEVLLSALLSALKKLKIGFDNDCFMGPVISNQAAEQLMAFYMDLLASGGKSLKPLQRPFSDKPLLHPGIVDVSDIPHNSDAECFGPLLQLKWVDSLEAAIEHANDTEYGLSAGLLSDVSSDWELFRHQIRAGIVNWNRPLTGASGSAPFGGIGASGNYRPGAWYAADYCAYPMAGMSSPIMTLPERLTPGIEL